MKMSINEHKRISKLLFPKRANEDIHVASNYRIKTTTYGNLNEIAVYPLPSCKRPTDGKSNIVKPEYDAVSQKSYRHKKAIQELNQKICSNFSSKDLFVTLTYSAKTAPEMKQAEKDSNNFIRRIKCYREKHGLPELKYIVVKEKGESQRIHFHIIMNAIDFNTIETIWGKGFTKCERLNPDDKGFYNLAVYLLKNPIKRRRWSGSKNLVQPKVEICDTYLSEPDKAFLCNHTSEYAHKALVEAKPHQSFIDCTITQSPYTDAPFIKVYTKNRIIPIPKSICGVPKR